MKKDLINDVKLTLKHHVKKGIYVKYIKRILDIVLALLGLFFLSPILIITAVLIRIKIGSPVLFKQDRPGLNEKIFTMYKFRSMTDAKDENGQLLSDEVRLIKLGRFLRSTSLDELPELFNILKGDMSVIGPRPLLVKYLSLYDNFQRKRHNVRPGIVGLAGVRGRNNQSWDDKFKHDIEYVDNISFLLDLKIFFLAIYTVFKREGVNTEGEATAVEFTGDCEGEKRV